MYSRTFSTLKKALSVLRGNGVTTTPLKAFTRVKLSFMLDHKVSVTANKIPVRHLLLKAGEPSSQEFYDLLFKINKLPSEKMWGEEYKPQLLSAKVKSSYDLIALLNAVKNKGLTEEQIRKWQAGIVNALDPKIIESFLKSITDAHERQLLERLRMPIKEDVPKLLRPSSRSLTPSKTFVFNGYVFKNENVKNLFYFIHKNTTLLKSLAELKSDDPKLIEVFSAYEKGDYHAEILRDEKIDLYLIHLMNENKIPFWHGITMYYFISAAKEDTNISVQKLMVNNELSVEGVEFLLQTCFRLNSIGYLIEFNDLKKFFLQLPPSEQCILNKSSDKGFGNESIESRIAKNVPFVYQNKLESKPGYYLIPSFSFINFILQNMEQENLEMLPIFGKVGKETLLKLRKNNFHPIPLYSKYVNSNLTEVHDGVLKGILGVVLHDIAHSFWANMLTKASRDQVFTLLDIRPSVPLNVEFSKRYYDLIFDFDLSPLQLFKDRQNRENTYIQGNLKIVEKEQLKLEQRETLAQHMFIIMKAVKELEDHKILTEENRNLVFKAKEFGHTLAKGLVILNNGKILLPVHKNMLITQPQYAEEIAVALVNSNAHNLLNNEHLALVMQAPNYSRSISNGLIYLDTAKLLNPSNISILMQYPKDAGFLGEGFKILSDEKFITPENKALLIKHHENAHEFANALVALNKNKILTPDLVNILDNNSKYISHLSDSILELHKAEILTKENIIRLVNFFQVNYESGVYYYFIKILGIYSSKNLMTHENFSSLIEDYLTEDLLKYKVLSEIMEYLRQLIDADLLSKGNLHAFANFIIKSENKGYVIERDIILTFKKLNSAGLLNSETRAMFLNSNDISEITKIAKYLPDKFSQDTFAKVCSYAPHNSYHLEQLINTVTGSHSTATISEEALLPILDKLAIAINYDKKPINHSIVGNSTLFSAVAQGNSVTVSDSNARFIKNVKL